MDYYKEIVSKNLYDNILNYTNALYYNNTGYTEDPEEVVQDVRAEFLIKIQNKPNLVIGNLEAYLKGMIRNRYNDLCRKRKIKENAYENIRYLNECEALYNSTTSSEFVDEILDISKSIGGDFYNIINLFSKGYTHQQISDELNLSKCNERQIFSRGKKKFREKVAKTQKKTTSSKRKELLKK